MLARHKAVLLVVGLSACADSPFEPRGQGERVPIGQVIDDQIADSVERRYSFEAAVDAEYAVFLKSFDGFVVLTVEDSVGRRCAEAVSASPGPVPLEQNSAGPCVTPNGGVELIKVHVFSARSARYQFEVYRVNRPPELAPDRFAFGDTVTGETIDPLVDADAFHVHGDSGQTITAVIQPVGGAAAGQVIVFVEDPDTVQWLGYTRGAGADPLFATGPLTLPATKDYRFVVRSEATIHPRHLGPYRFWSYVVQRDPEQLRAAVVANVEVKGERIDYPDDVDEFTFHDTAGAEYNAFLESGRPFVLQAWSPANVAIKGRVDSDDDTTLFHHGIGVFQLPATGTYKLRVKAQAGLPSAVADTGAYRLMLYRIDRRPEVRAETVLVGDTIIGEPIDPPGDIDEFTLSATPGDTLASWFRLSGDLFPGITSMAFQVFDPTSQALLVEMFFGTAGPFVQGARFVVPATGTVHVRVGSAAGESSSAPYEFFFGPAPPIP